MKRLLCLILTACALLALAACGAPREEPTSAVSQSATNTYTLFGGVTEVAVDLTGGWSAAFSADSVYLYDGPDNGDRPHVAAGYVIDRATFDLNTESHRHSADFAENAGSVTYSEGKGGSTMRLFPVGNGAYFMIEARYGTNAEDAFRRFSVRPAPDWNGVRLSSASGAVDYLTLVNRLNPLPDGWDDRIETATVVNTLGESLKMEYRTCAAYLRLKAALAAEGVEIDLRGAYRSAEEQQALADRAAEERGEVYAAVAVAAPGRSEYQTGLALDLCLVLDGELVREDEAMLEHLDVWSVVRGKLAEYGFIQRCPWGKEHITGYSYEPWHIRYLDDPVAAGKIMADGVTLEEYLGKASSEKPEIMLPASMVYTFEELGDALMQIKCMFASFPDCTLHSLRYDGDEYNNPENVAWLSELGGRDYRQAARFVSSLSTGDEPVGELDLNRRYDDYEWWLGRDRDGNWDLVAHGYPAAPDAAEPAIGEPATPVTPA